MARPPNPVRCTGHQARPEGAGRTDKEVEIMETTRIPLSQCVESSYQNRKELGDVSGLARSIEVNGQITPLRCV